MFKPFKVAFVQILVPSYKLTMFQNINALKNIDLTLFAGDRGPSTLAKGSPITGVKHIPLRNKLLQIGPFSIIWQKNIQKLLAPTQFDVIILPEGILYISNYILILRCLINRIPFGFYSHGYNHQRRETWLSRPLETLRKIVHRLASIIIVYSDEGAKHLIENSHISPQKVFIAPNTLNTKEILDRVSQVSKKKINETRKSIGLTNDGLLLAYIGRIEPIKNPNWVLDSVQKLLREGFSVHAIFIGTGSQLPALKKQIAEHPSLLTNAVTFVGNLPIDEVDQYLACSDICVMPGMTGLAVVHAFAAGKPYITIESPHHSPEIFYLQHGVNGLISGPSQEEFFQAIKTLILNPKLRRQLGKNAFHDAKNKLSMGKQIKGFQDAFEYVAFQSTHRRK